ncbi:MAG: hypothetical protein HY719_00870 [Planctomycetes bacterium]|nr:hypothetical protein [Planctomycetota bacterium]
MVDAPPTPRDPRPPAVRRASRRLFTCGCLGVTLALAALLLGEATLRLYDWREPVAIPVAKGNDRRYHHVGKPHHVESGRGIDGRAITQTHNSLGFKDGEFLKVRVPGVLRVALLGDSFAYGMCDDQETIDHHLEAALAARLAAAPAVAAPNASPAPRSAEVYNFGYVSYSTIIHLVLLKSLVFDYQPDVVVLMLDPSDVQDDFLYEQVAVRDGAGAVVGVDGLEANPIGGVSRLYQYVARKFIWPLPTALRDDERRRDPGDIRQTRNRVAHYRLPPEAWAEHFARTFEYLRQCAALCRARRAPLLVAHYPWPMGVTARQFTGDPDKLRAWGFEPGVVCPDPLGDALAAFCACENLPLLALREPIRQACETIRCYYDTDPHFTPEGNRFVAGEIARRLEENGWLSGPTRGEGP